VGAKIQNLFQIKRLNINIILGVLTGFQLYLFLKKKKDAISIPNAITQSPNNNLKKLLKLK